MISLDFLGESLRQGKHADVSSRRCNDRRYRKREQKVKLGRMESKYLLASLQEETQPALSTRNTYRQARRKPVPQTCTEATNPTGVNPQSPSVSCPTLAMAASHKIQLCLPLAPWHASPDTFGQL